MECAPYAEWSQEIPPDEWRVYQRVITAAFEAQLSFALGGAFALAAYTDRWRNTKDLDFYLIPDTAPVLIELLRRLGATDYHEVERYDRRWIYRGFLDGCIVDVIWAMANQRAQVDQRWVTAGPELCVGERRIRVLPAEELIWSKLFVLQKGRCDWPDLFNIFYFRGATLDWRHLLQRVGEEAPLLASVLLAFSWLCPEKVNELPAWLWEDLGLAVPSAVGDFRNRAPLLDSRPWFVPLRA